MLQATAGGHRGGVPTAGDPGNLPPCCAIAHGPYVVQSLTAASVCARSTSGRGSGVRLAGPRRCSLRYKSTRPNIARSCRLQLPPDVPRAHSCTRWLAAQAVIVAGGGAANKSVRAEMQAQVPPPPPPSSPPRASCRLSHTCRPFPGRSPPALDVLPAAPALRRQRRDGGLGWDRAAPARESASQLPAVPCHTAAHSCLTAAASALRPLHTMHRPSLLALLALLAHRASPSPLLTRGPGAVGAAAVRPSQGRHARRGPAALAARAAGHPLDPEALRHHARQEGQAGRRRRRRRRPAEQEGQAERAVEN